MDDQLKLKIAASLDLPSDTAADPDVARALDDPEARDYARSLHTLESALRHWPVRKRSDNDWDRLAARIDAKLEEASRERAKVRKGKKVSPAEPDPAAVPIFTDDSPQTTESKQAMSEPQESDDDLENLAALTRTSTVPSGLPITSVRPAMSAMSDVDDTSSGIVDIKKLAEMARSEEAAAKPAAEAKAAAKAAEAAEKASEKKPAKTDDVMVTPARAATPAPLAEAPRKGGGTLWGVFGGMALMAGAFALYTNMQGTSPDEATSASPPSESAPAASAAAPTGATPPSVAAPPEAQSAPAAPMPTTAAQPEAPAALPVVAAPTPAMPEAAPAPAERERVEASSRQPVAAPRPAPTAARDRAAAAAPAAQTARAQRPAPTEPAAPAAAPPPAAAPAAPAARPAVAGGARSVDDLMRSVAGGGEPAPAAAAQPAAELPERPTRSQITSVLTGLNGQVRSCTNGQTGTAPVSLVISNDGTVSSANVSGQFAGSAAGECISGVVRRAHFPRFRAQQVTLTYPFVILPPR